jgi:hypothetical protein
MLLSRYIIVILDIKFMFSNLGSTVNYHQSLPISVLLSRQSHILPSSTVTYAIYAAVWSDPFPLRDIHPPNLLHVPESTNPVYVSHHQARPETRVRRVGRARKPDLSIRMGLQETFLKGCRCIIGKGGREGIQVTKEGNARQSSQTQGKTRINRASFIKMIPPVQLETEIRPRSDVLECGSNTKAKDRRIAVVAVRYIRGQRALTVGDIFAKPDRKTSKVGGGMCGGWDRVGEVGGNNAGRGQRKKAAGHQSRGEP